MNDITKLMCLDDDNIKILDTATEGDLKRLSSGFTNFEHIRNRFLFSTIKSPELKK